MANRRNRRDQKKEPIQIEATGTWWENNLWLFIIGGFFIFAIGVFVWREQQKPPPSGSHVTSTTLLEESRPFELGYGGPADAPVTITEYASLTCGTCRDFHEKVVIPLKEADFFNGNVRLRIRHYPLNKPAMDAALLLSCTPRNKAARLLDTLLAKQEAWALSENPRTHLKAYFLEIGMKEAAFENCLADETRKKTLAREQERAHEELDIRSTPTIFINETLYTASYNINALRKKVFAALENAEGDS